MRKLPDAHTQGVTSVSFNRDTSHILSTSFDHSIRYNFRFFISKDPRTKVGENVEGIQRTHFFC